jgi:hypothetical protein
MKLVWHADHLIEEDWLRYIFGDLIEDEITDLDLHVFDDDAIHVVSGNWSPMQTYERYFQECRERCKHIILVHVSDEWFSGSYRLYQYFDLVIRWNHTYLASGGGIVTIPLGYPNGTGGSLRPADQRQYAWSFIGEIKSSRIAMAAAFDGFAPQFMTRTDSLASTNPKRLRKAEFDTVLEDTVFAPCPMGNATIDTTRMYESLEFGCIPLVEVRFSLDYYANLLGPNPIPAFRSWREARRYAENAYHDKASLLGKQAEIRNWWQSYKATMSSQVREVIRGPSHALELHRYAAKFRNRFAFIHEPLRIIELLRHQSAGSLLRRLAHPTGPLTRIIADMSGGRFGTPASVVIKDR